eukprot:TRINITY_DN11871_c0_g1_i1.p1 TRINITY_DN11871_c0_g1~~TRINITY_DN11871_c0_g1_i1.p1  ORF type:complete len:325 (-),score=82.87 TRINITY_DN11871_c0_g1_i1:4-978(-)
MEIIEKPKINKKLLLEKLLSEEKNYVMRLGILINHYFKSLSISFEGLEKSLFYHIETLYKIHCALLEEINKIDLNEKDSWVKISEIFIKIIMQMRSIYSQFFQNYDNAVGTLTTLKKNEKFCTELETLETSEAAKGKDLLSHLTEPTQRLLHYHFLLTELDRVTQEENKEDREKLLSALERVNKILDHVKGRISLKRNLEKQNEIQKAITNPKYNLIDSARKFVFEDVAIYSSGAKIDLKKGSDCYLFLYNDLLVVVHVIPNLPETEQNLEVMKMIPLDDNSTLEIKDKVFIIAFGKKEKIEFIVEEGSSEFFKHFENRKTQFY